MTNNLLKTKSDVFCFLCEQKSLFLYKAQEAEDLGNPEGAAELRALAEQIGVVTKRIIQEKQERPKSDLSEQIQSAEGKAHKATCMDVVPGHKFER